MSQQMQPTNNNKSLNNQENKKGICSHEGPCWMSSIKGMRQGVYYGAKVRFFHAFVMTMLFKQGTMKEKLVSIMQLTYEHAKKLGIYVFLYKSGVCLLNQITKKESKAHSFISGGVFGYVMYGRDQTAVSMQMILYLLSRIIHGGMANLQEENVVPRVGINAKKNGKEILNHFFPILASLCWALVMFLFEDDFQARQNKTKKPTLQGSLYSSMDFLYKESDKKYSHWSELVPFKIPDAILKKNMGSK